MVTTSRECPSCKAGLPADAVFCHKCGTATPITLDPSRQSAPLDPIEAAEAAQRAAVQNALGETYEVRRLLGRGGFAEVYVAYDKRLKREIAVKTIRRDLVTTETLLERFQAEAEAVAKLRHPNVIPIYSVGEAGGLAFFTMPLVEGESLATVVGREGRIPVSESLRILREASNALHAAHRVGVVHRDIKPENIMLEGPERSAVVMDFGIAKSDGSGGKGLTGTGMLIGTPDYMSPEQAMGERTLDARSDQYSLAIVGFRMLTGRVPFEGSSAQTLLFKTVTEVPPPASDVAADVPIALSDVLSKALSKRPDDRFESMAAFAAALTRVEQAEQGGAAARTRRRVDFAVRVREMRAAIPMLTRAAAIAMVAVVATLVLNVLGSPRAPFVVAPQRADAVFAAKTVLGPLAGPSRRSETASFVSEDSVYGFLREQLGRDVAEQRALTDIPPWMWTVRSLSTADRNEWFVAVGPGGKPVGYRRTIADTLPRPTISLDSARALASSALSALGWNVSTLRPIGDSTISRKARTDYLLRWSLPSSAIKWRGDSAYLRLSVTVSGDKVTRVSQTLRMPEGYRVRSAGGLIATFVAIFFVGVIAAIVVIVRRQQFDELQWTMMLRVVAFLAVIFVAEVLTKLPETIAAARAGVGQPFSQVLTVTIGLLMVAIGGLAVAVAGESMMYKHRPTVSAGLSDLTRGRVFVPEIVTSVGYGYAIAAVLAAVTALAIFLSQVPGIGAPVFPSFPFGELPFASVVGNSIVAGVALPVATLFVLGLAQSIRGLSKVATLVPAALTAAFAALNGVPGTTTAVAVTTVLLISVAIARFGLLAAMLALTFALQIEDIVSLLRAGDAHNLLHGGALVVVFLLPAALAVSAYRRLTVKSDRTAESISGGVAADITPR